MRTSWWAGIFGLVLTCAVVLICLAAYRHFNQPPPSTASIAPSASSAQAELPPRAQEQVLPLAAMDDGRSDEARVQDIDSAPATSAPAALEPVQLPSPQREARLEDAPAPVAVETAPVSRSYTSQPGGMFHTFDASGFPGFEANNSETRST